MEDSRHLSSANAECCRFTHSNEANARQRCGSTLAMFTFVSVSRSDGKIGVHSLEPAGQVEFSLDPDLQPGAGWSNYPMTVARRLARNFPGLGVGADLAFRSTLPPASGMSSSSALIVP